MVYAATHLSPERLSTKALAAAGQFRSIALWLNHPLIPEGIYAQVSQDHRPGCIRIVVEYERTPNRKPLTQYICHLMWQLNSPLIEGIHLVARPIGTAKSLWEQRIRVMTPALRERINRERGHGSPAAVIPPQITPSHRSVTMLPGFSLHVLLAGQLKTVRAFMLTGSAVAAFVFGCMLEVVMSGRQEPALPFQHNEQVRSHKPASIPQTSSQEPQLPTFQADFHTITADQKASVNPAHRQSSPVAEATPVSYKIEPERDRPNVVNAALEPVGVLQHERLEHPNAPTITLLFGGDVDLDGLPYSQLEYDGQLLSGIPAYRQADLAMVNLQDPLATADTSLEEEWLERSRPEAINLLKEGGVDLVNLTGKEALSSGEQGLVETLDTLDREGIFRVGAGRSEREARRPEIIDVKGQRIAYLSYDRDFSLAAHDSVSGVNAVDLQNIVQDIQAIRDEVDWLVVNYRWTGEPPTTAAESPTNLARLAIDQGADLVVGQHPSLLEGAEIYKGRPIAYSLGDFVFGQATEATSSETVILQVALRERQMKVDLIPIKVQNGQPQKADGSEAQRILNKVQAASQDFQEPMPPSIVLDARTSRTSEVLLPSKEDSFTGNDGETLTSPASAEVLGEGAHNEPLPKEVTTPTMPEESPALDDEMSSETPIETDDSSTEIEVEPIPDGLLDDWGQKESPNTLYEPESTLPPQIRLDMPEIEKKSPHPKAQPNHPPETKEEKRLTPEMTDPIQSELDVTQPNEVIAPYSEPLIGPLSSAPEAIPARKMYQDLLATTPPIYKGMPESRVFEPLNTLEPATEETLTIEVKEQSTIAQSNPN